MQHRRLRSSLWLLVLVVGIWYWTMPVAAAGSIIVTTTADQVADDGACSLREAIIAANTDDMVGGCPAGSGPDSITFDPALPRPALFVLSQNGADENTSQTGDLDITGVLTINAEAVDQPLPTIVIDGNGADRVFEILSGAQVTMTGVTIRNGDPGLSANGGGILVDLTAQLTLSASQVISNRALNGGGLQTVGGVTIQGGAIEANSGGAVNNDGGLLVMKDVTVAHNYGGYSIRNQHTGVLLLSGGLVSANQGGGIYNAAATATISNALIISNTDGSALYNTGVSLTRLSIKQSTILSNTAASGGGIANEGIGAKVEIADSRISGNQAAGAGGGFFNNGIMTINNSTLDHNQARSGGGLHHLGGALTATNVTIAHNRAGDNGGGIYNGADALLNNVTLVANSAAGEGGNLFNDEAQWAVSNTIVAQAQHGANCVNSQGFLKSLGHNLESTNHCNFQATSDLTNTEPLLGPLQDNGGPTVTHALLVGSPAIDHGDGCPATDQRGVVRPQGIACDIGAYEFARTADLALAVSVAPPTIEVGARLTYTLIISNLGPLPATALTLTDTLPTGATLLTATLAGSDCALGGGITCTVASLAPGLSLTATIVVTAPLSAGVMTNTATITATIPDLNTDNNRIVTVNMVVPKADLIPPGPVTNLTATAITTQGATLTWDPAGDNVGVAGYRIYAQKNQARQPSFLVGEMVGAGSTYTVTTLQARTSYQLWVLAYDLAGNVGALDATTSVSLTTLGLTVGMVQIGIEPPLPTDHDPISITISGVYTSSCTPHYQSHQRTGQIIAITSAPSAEPFCLPAEFAWGYTVGLEALAAGCYTVTHTLAQIVDQTVFTVTVVESPAPPVFHIDGTQAQTAVANVPFHFRVQASGLPMPTYTLVQAPSGMTIDTSSGQITWLPTVEAVGEAIVIVRATNDLGSADYTFTLMVQMANANEPRIFLPVVVKA